MYSSRVSLFALLLVLSFAVVPNVGNAQSGYFTSRGCSGCHTPAPITCNGCHGHGTHPTLAKDSMNLIATTDKASYVPGDDITVTLAGGYIPGSWVRVNVYANNGVLLVSNKTDCPYKASNYSASCDLPVTLKTRAVAGMTGLYVAWMGHENDSDDAARGTPIPPTSVIGVGRRVAPSPAPATHIEEVILTNSFSVTANATDSPKAGGGSFDWILISGLIGMFVARGTTRRS